MLFHSYYPALCLYAQKLLGDLDKVREVVQDVFVRLYEQREALPEITFIKPYLYKSVHNSCLNLIKQVFVHHSHQQHLLHQLPTSDSYDTLQQAELEARLGHYNFQEEIKSMLNNVPTRKLTLEILDEGSTTDFYNIDVQQFYKDVPITAPTFYTDKLLEAGDPCGFLGNGNEFNLSDICFNGNAYTLNIGVELRGSVLINNQFLQVGAQQVVVTLRSISRDYYKHLESSYQPGGIELAFSGQHVLHSNVKGGFGMLATYNEQKIIINL